MKIFYYFLQSIPECIGTLALSLALAKVSLRWGRILIGGTLLSIIIYVIRSLPIPFGFHLPIGIFVIFLAFTRMTNVRPSQLIIAICISFFTLALLEFLVNTAFVAYTHMDLEQAIANERLWALVGIAQDSILFIIALIVSNFLKPVEEAWKVPRYRPRL